MQHVEDAIVRLGVKSTPEQIAEVLGMVEAVKQRVRDIEARLKDQMVEWISDNGDLYIETVRYYLGTKKTTKCANVPGCAEALLGAVGGDFEQFMSMFTSQPFKHGACREPLGDQWGEFFKVEEEVELREGKPAKQLQKLDTRFLR